MFAVKVISQLHLKAFIFNLGLKRPNQSDGANAAKRAKVDDPERLKRKIKKELRKLSRSVSFNSFF